MRATFLIFVVSIAILVAVVSSEKLPRDKYYDDYRGPLPGPYGRFGRGYKGHGPYHGDRRDYRDGQYYPDGRPYPGRYDRDYYGPPPPYDFAYNAEDGDGAHAHSQVSDGRGVRGQYTIQLADGRSRRVDYIADEGGFRATVDTNEPGTESKSPADTEFRSTALPGDEAAIRYGPRPGNRFYNDGYGPDYGRDYKAHHGDHHYNRGYNRW